MTARSIPEMSQTQPPQRARCYLRESVFAVVLQKSTPTQIRQRMHHTSNRKEQRNGFRGGVDF